MSYRYLDHLSIDTLERKPLLFVHMLLERLEQDIDECVASYSGRDQLIPGERHRDRWERLRNPEEIDKIFIVDQGLRHEYASLAKLCRRMEEREIAALREGKAA